MSWYVIEAAAGRDGDVSLRLAAARLDVWRPMREIRPSIRKGAKVARQPRLVPRFERYLFLRVDGLTEALIREVRATPGVVGWLRYAGSDDPAQVSDATIAAYRQALPSARNDGEIGVGDTVEIRLGSFAGWQGVVTRVVDSGRVLTVAIDAFDRRWPVVIESGYVERVAIGQRPPIARTDKDRTKRRRSA